MIGLLARTILVHVPDSTFENRLAAFALASAGGIAAGGALAVAWTDIRNRKIIPNAMDYVFARVGFAVSIGLIAYLVARNPVIEVHDWRTVLFLVGVFLAAYGYGSLALKRWIRRRQPFREE